MNPVELVENERKKLVEAAQIKFDIIKDAYEGLKGFAGVTLSRDRVVIVNNNKDSVQLCYETDGWVAVDRVTDWCNWLWSNSGGKISKTKEFHSILVVSYDLVKRMYLINYCQEFHNLNQVMQRVAEILASQ